MKHLTPLLGLLALAAILVLIKPSDIPINERPLWCHQPTLQDRFDSLEFVYNCFDHRVVYQDLRLISSGYLDTLIVEAGVFAYLQHGFPLHTADCQSDLFRYALHVKEKVGIAQSQVFFDYVIDYYEVDFPQELGHFTCGTGASEFWNNTAMLAAAAFYEKGELDKAIDVLAPRLTDSETLNTRMHELYMKYLIERYGVEVVQEETRKATENVCQANGEDLTHEFKLQTMLFEYPVGVLKTTLHYRLSAKEVLNILEAEAFFKINRKRHLIDRFIDRLELK
ncbi:MAG: hypothetical protein AAF433_16670 [Bacteroidota bacterium]